MAARGGLTRRLFFAFDVDDSCRQAVAELVAGLCQTPGAESWRTQVRWVASAHLHVTVRFLGETPIALVDELRRDLANPLARPGFRMTFGPVIGLPARGRPRVVALSVRDGAREAADVARELGDRLAARGVEPDSRPFRPHMTLGRVRRAGRLARLGRDLVAGRAASTVVEDVTAYESVLSSEGPQYAARWRVPLRSVNSTGDQGGG